MSSTNSNLELVPETVLKRRHDMDEMKVRRSTQDIIRSRVNQKDFSETTAIKVRKIETVLATARMRRHHAIRYNRVRKKRTKTQASNKKTRKRLIPHEDLSKMKNANNSIGAKMVFCVRIRNHRGVPREVKNVLNQFRLRHEYHGVFLRYDSPTQKLLHMVEPWITYGIISKATASDLLHRRGHFKLEKKRVPISDNTLVENVLSKKTNGSIICVQDLVHELVSVGNDFHKANGCLWPFCLTMPKSKYQKKTLDLQDGGDYGDRGQKMDEYLQQIL